MDIVKDKFLFSSNSAYVTTAVEGVCKLFLARRSFDASLLRCLLSHLCKQTVALQARQCLGLFITSFANMMHQDSSMKQCYVSAAARTLESLSIEEPLKAAVGSTLLNAAT